MMTTKNYIYQLLFGIRGEVHKRSGYIPDFYVFEEEINAYIDEIIRQLEPKISEKICNVDKRRI